MRGGSAHRSPCMGAWIEMFTILKSIYHLLRGITAWTDLIWNSCLFSLRKAEIGKDVVIHGRVRLYGRGKLIVEDCVTLNSDIRYNPIGGQSYCSFAIEEGACVRIQEGAGISNVAICSRAGIDIGRNVFIGGNCRIYDTDFHAILLKYRLEQPDTHVCSKKVCIRDGVFIGSSCIILKGITIGENSVIGAGSVVSKDIPPNQIWGGNPIRFIKAIEDLEKDALKGR